jgi:hypothetical protein
MHTCAGHGRRVVLNKASNLEVVKTPLSGHKINDYVVLYLCHWRAGKWAFYGFEYC